MARIRKAVIFSNAFVAAGVIVIHAGRSIRVRFVLNPVLPLNSETPSRPSNSRPHRLDVKSQSLQQSDEAAAAPGVLIDDHHGLVASQ